MSRVSATLTAKSHGKEQNSYISLVFDVTHDSMIN